MKPNYTDITIILDRSGSMDAIAVETISGFNKFLNDQRQLPGETTISLVQFNHSIAPTFSAVPIREVVSLSAEDYRPHGHTALLDAVGKTINDTGARLRTLAER